MTNPPEVPVARVGVIWPGRPPVDVEDADLRAFLPRNVVLQVIGPRPPPQPPRVTLERIKYLAACSEIEDCVDELRPFEPQAVAYACGTASYVNGLGGDYELVERMVARALVPATTTSTEMVNALRFLNVGRVAVVSPHIRELNERLVSFLSDSGIRVVSLKALELLGSIQDTSPDAVVDLTRQANRSDADGIFIACTSLQTASTISMMEAEFGKPVVTANQATLWGLLSLAGANVGRTDRGRLFSAHGAPRTTASSS